MILSAVIRLLVSFHSVCHFACFMVKGTSTDEFLLYRVSGILVIGYGPHVYAMPSV